MSETKFAIGFVLLCLATALVLFLSLDRRTGGAEEIGPDFLDIASLKREYSPGADAQILEKKILASGYKIVSCEMMQQFKERENTICFWKRYCYQPDGVAWDRIGIAHDGSERIVLIDGGGGMTFHGACKKDDELSVQSRVLRDKERKAK